MKGLVYEFTFRLTARGIKLADGGREKESTSSTRSVGVVVQVTPEAMRDTIAFEAIVSAQIAKNLLGSDEFKRQVDGLDGQVFWPRGGS